MLVLRACLRALPRMRRSADLVFGIVAIYVVLNFRARHGSGTGINVNGEAARVWRSSRHLLRLLAFAAPKNFSLQAFLLADVPHDG